MKSIIDELYKNSPSKLINKLEYCDCGCCEGIDFKVLEGTSRQNIDFEVMGRYADKAITTIGTVEDYKYFLPRIAEMVLGDEMRSSINFCLLSKLELGEFWTWGTALGETVYQFLEQLIELKKANSFIDMDEDEVKEINKLLSHK